MEIISLGILFKDREYAEAAARVIAEKGRYFLPAVLDKDRIHNFDGKLIITDDETIKAENIVYTGRFMLPDAIMAAAVEKYGKLYSISTDNLNFYYSRKEKQAKLITVIGAEGGAGATSAADGLAEELVVYYDKSVCRISLSAFPEENLCGVCELKQLLFLLENKNDCKKTMDCISDINIDEYFPKDRCGIYRVCYGDSINPLAAAGSLTLYGFFAFVCETGAFDCIIIDIPAEAVKNTEEIISITDGIVTVEKYSSSAIRGGKLHNYLNLILSGETENRIIRFINFVSENYTETEEHNEVSYKNKGTVNVEYDPESFCKDGVKIDGAFGLAVKNIAHSLIFC
ncbi:MAG: hypothetical protein HFG67_02090 [Firmicutes bacterium]|nr:hypothetical protein [Bacillota bacterium]